MVRLNAAIALNDRRTQFINRFTDGKDKYLQQIEAESLKRQDSDPNKGFIFKVTRAVDKCWSDLGADERAQKNKDFFLPGVASAAPMNKVAFLKISP